VQRIEERIILHRRCRRYDTFPLDTAALCCGRIGWGFHIGRVLSQHPSGFIIAVVDDDERILGSLGILLESDDHAVRLFATGAALLESDCLPQAHCLISDIAMPGMNGFELVQRVQAVRPGLPIILITGHSDLPNGSLQVGARRYRLFKKPFDGPELLQAVTQALRTAT
jgi:FixJ family two-component response regulator